MRRVTVPMVASIILFSCRAWAAPPPPPWKAMDIGGPQAAGGTDVDPSGVWSVKGSGEDIFGFADKFHFAFQSVKGDGSISAKFLGAGGGNSDGSKAGLMIRENDGTGAANLNLTMTSGAGIAASSRPLPDDATDWFGPVGPNYNRQGMFLRLQRVGNEIACFYSRDGALWTQASLPPHRLTTLKENALFGLAVTSFEDGAITTGRFERVQVESGLASSYGISACGGDRSVLLQWRGPRSAIGYHIYRGPSDASRGQMVKLTDAPVTNPSFTDTTPGLVNGASVTYGVTTLTPGPGGTAVEGPMVSLPAAPVEIPAGFLGCSINEVPRAGSVGFDAATGEITIRGSGEDIWWYYDRCYFAGQPIAGDVRITARILARPRRSNDWSKAGLMIRESIDPGARHMFVGLAGANGLFYQWRAVANDTSDWPGLSSIENEDLKPPVLLRLTRRGNTMTAEFSTDDGKTFEEAGESYTFEPALPKTIYVGLAISSGDRTQSTQAKFSNLTIQPL